jgi:alpha-tubulin suppressor-like RCC1 family protein
MGANNELFAKLTCVVLLILTITQTVLGATQQYSFGSNGFGQLGDGTTTDKLYPVYVVDNNFVLSDKTVTSIATGMYHSVFLGDGSVYAVGYNTYGQVGDGTTTTRYYPVKLSTTNIVGKIIKAVGAGWSHSMLLSTDGKVYTFGDNSSGQLGDGTTTTRTVPISIIDNNLVLSGKTVNAIAAGGYHSVLLTTIGKVYTFGGNSYGQLGDSTFSNRYYPVAIVDINGVLTGKTITAIAAGGYHTILLSSDGKVFGTGYNYEGQLGDGTSTTRYNPVAVNSNNVLLGRTVTAIAAGTYHTILLTSDGRVVTFGYNAYGQIGDGSTTHKYYPTLVVDNYSVLFGRTVTAISGGLYHTSLLTSDGHGYTFGYNANGELGDGTRTNSLYPMSYYTGGLLSGKSLTCISSGHGSHQIVAAAPITTTTTVAPTTTTTSSPSTLSNIYYCMLF